MVTHENDEVMAATIKNKGEWRKTFDFARRKQIAILTARKWKSLDAQAL
jgi:hypothetical protein